MTTAVARCTMLVGAGAIVIAACGVGEDDSEADAGLAAITSGCDVEPVSSGSNAMTLDEAAIIVDEVGATFATRDFASFEDVLGDGGTWVSISGEQYDQDTVAGFLASFDEIETFARGDRSVAGPEGCAFEVVETVTSGEVYVFWIVIARDADGSLRITEQLEPPPGDPASG